MIQELKQITLNIGEKISERRVSNLTRLDLTRTENMGFLVCCETGEFKLAELEKKSHLVLCRSI